MTLRKNKLFFGYCLFWLVFFALVWSRAIGFDEQGNVFAGHKGIWGDGAAHFTMGSAMAYRELILEQSPLLIGVPFHYPFVVNLISAVLIRAGVPFFAAFTFPSFLFSLFFVAVLFLFYKKIFQSEKIAFLAACVFLFNGGMGFVTYFQDIFSSAHPLHDAIFPPGNSTSIPSLQIHWVNVVDSMLIPQRAFQLGLPLGLLVLIRLYDFVFKRPLTVSYPQMVVPALLLGFLPLIHMHSFVAVCLIVFVWFLGDMFYLKSHFSWKRILAWGLFSLVAIDTLAVLSYFFGFFESGQALRVRWFPGWYAKETGVNFLGFWFKNWGLTPLVSLVGFVIFMGKETGGPKNRSGGFFFLPFVLLLVVSNLFLFHPWIWDNTKYLAWASIGISGFAGYFISELGGWKKWVPVLLFLTMTTSGMLDCYRLLLPSMNKIFMYSAEEMALADWVRQNTDPHSIWLTGGHHNNFLFNLTGRQPLITSEGWMWSHGYKYGPVLADVREMFRKPEEKGAYGKYGVDYVLIGPIEIKDWSADLKKFEKLFTPVKTTENYTIFSR